MTPLNRALVKAFRKTAVAAVEPEVRAAISVEAPWNAPSATAQARLVQSPRAPATELIYPLIVRKQVVENGTSTESETVRGWVEEVRQPLRRQTHVAAWDWPAICPEVLRIARSGFEAVADQFLHDLTERGRQSIAFVGAEPESGTTSTMLTLAHVLAARQTSVLLIDADFERPGLLEAFSLSKRVGLWEAVASATSIDAALQPLVGTSLTLLPLVRPVSDQNVGLAQIVILESLIANLRNRYSLLLIDMGPSLASRTLAFGRAGIIDSLVEVCRAESAATISTEQGNLCERAGVEFLGRIETFTKGAATATARAPN